MPDRDPSTPWLHVQRAAARAVCSNGTNLGAACAGCDKVARNQAREPCALWTMCGRDGLTRYRNRFLSCLAVRRAPLAQLKRSIGRGDHGDRGKWAGIREDDRRYYSPPKGPILTTTDDRRYYNPPKGRPSPPQPPQPAQPPQRHPFYVASHQILLIQHFSPFKSLI